MLTITFTFFFGLCALSFTLYGAFRTTINGLVSIQKTETDDCVKEIKDELTKFQKGQNNPVLILKSTLSKHFHCISTQWDRVFFLKNNLAAIVSVIITNIIYLLIFYYVCTTLVTKYSSTIDEVFLNLIFIAIAGYIIWIITIVIGFYSLHKADRYEILIRMMKFDEFRNKLKKEL